MYKIIKSFEFKIGKLYTILMRNSFKKFGKDSFMFFKSRIDCPENIEIGDNVTIFQNCWLNALKDYNENCKIIIDNGATLAFNVQVSAGKYIYIGENVGVSKDCVIVDHLHGYSNINESILYQEITEPQDVIIEKNSFLAANVVIAPGVHIGEHVFIGANSVVVHNIPSYTVAAGAPAKVIKKYNFEKNMWEKVKS